MSTLKKVAVMLVFADGGAVEVFDPKSGRWCICHDPSWSWESLDYRIAPKTLSPKDVRRAEIVAAYEAGAEIEYRQYGSDRWIETGEPLWRWKDFEYRVKETKPTLVTYYSPDGATLTFVRGSKCHKRYAESLKWTELT